MQMEVLKGALAAVSEILSRQQSHDSRLFALITVTIQAHSIILLALRHIPQIAKNYILIIQEKKNKKTSI